MIHARVHSRTAQAAIAASNSLLPLACVCIQAGPQSLVICKFSVSVRSNSCDAMCTPHACPSSAMYTSVLVLYLCMHVRMLCYERAIDPSKQ